MVNEDTEERLRAAFAARAAQVPDDTPEFLPAEDTPTSLRVRRPTMVWAVPLLAAAAVAGVIIATTTSFRSTAAHPNGPPARPSPVSTSMTTGTSGAPSTGPTSSVSATRPTSRAVTPTQTAGAPTTTPVASKPPWYAGVDFAGFTPAGCAPSPVRQIVPPAGGPNAQVALHGTCAPVSGVGTRSWFALVGFNPTSSHSYVTASMNQISGAVTSVSVVDNTVQVAYAGPPPAGTSGDLALYDLTAVASGSTAATLTANDVTPRCSSTSIGAAQLYLVKTLGSDPPGPYPVLSSIWFQGPTSGPCYLPTESMQMTLRSTSGAVLQVLPGLVGPRIYVGLPSQAGIFHIAAALGVATFPSSWVRNAGTTPPPMIASVDLLTGWGATEHLPIPPVYHGLSDAMVFGLGKE